MKTRPALYGILLLAVSLSAQISGCAPLALPFAAPTIVAPQVLTTPTRSLEASTLQTETPTPAATGTVAPSPTPETSSSLPLPTRISPPPVAMAAPGVYATRIRLDPPAPVGGPDSVTFYSTFMNTTLAVQQVKWIVKIYRPDDWSHSFGETAAVVSNIQPGTSELASASNWRTNPFGCEPFAARVFMINTDVSADPIEFKKPDGTLGPYTNFQVCSPPPQ